VRQLGPGALPDACADEFGLFGVGMRAINLKGGWVYFILSGDY
jgi:hypothetical protein